MISIRNPRRKLRNSPTTFLRIKIRKAVWVELHFVFSPQTFYRYRFQTLRRRPHNSSASPADL